MEKYHELKVYAPDSLDSLAPLEIFDGLHAMNMAYVERYGISYLPEKWQNSQGIYLLFSHIKPGHKFEAYVGQTISGFKQRLVKHDQTKLFWDTAILIRRDTHNGFNSLELNALEGRLVDLLNQSSNVHVYNEYPTGDKTLRDTDKHFIDQITLSILRAMFLRGYRNQHMGAEADRLQKAIQNGYKSPASEFNYHVPPVPSDPPPTQQVEDSLDRSQRKFNELRTWRKQQGAKEGKNGQLYLILPDKTLTNISLSSPKTIEDLLMISGLGPNKVENYGEDILVIMSK